MSNKVDDESKEENRALGAILGWVNLSSPMPNNENMMIEGSAGSIELECHLTFSFLFSLETNLASPTSLINWNQLFEANRNAQNLQLAHEIVFNEDFQLDLPKYEEGR